MSKMGVGFSMFLTYCNISKHIHFYLIFHSFDVY